MGESLADLALTYDLYPAVTKKSKTKSRRKKTKVTFLGSHCAGNDAVANLKGYHRIVMDSTFGQDPDDNDDDKTGYMADVATPDTALRIDQWLKKPMINMRRNMVIMCFDFEGVDQRTSEFGWSWSVSSELASITAGQDLKNWWPTLEAKHYLVREFENHPGSEWTTGDPKSFYPEFGKTVIYDPETGTRPFDELFESITEGTTLGGVVPPIPRSSNTATLLAHQRIIATVSSTDYVPPHRRSIIAARDIGATLGGVAPLNDDEVEDYDDNDEILEDAYLDIMRLVCPDELNAGKACRTRKDCRRAYHLCKAFSKPPHMCPHDEFEHYDGGGELVVHIKTSCKSFQRHRKCIIGEDECKWGHDHPAVRRALVRWREREAARNWWFNGGAPGMQR